VAKEARVATAGGDPAAAALAGLFARAADCLAQDEAPPDDVAGLLRALDFAAPADTAELRANRIALLRAASRFARVFQLSAPEAPGLVFLGAEVDPGMIAAGHGRTALVGVGGMGLSLSSAFQSCAGEGVELLSQFETGDEPLIATTAALLRDAAKGAARGFLEALFARIEVSDEAPLEALPAQSLHDDATLLLPADMCLRRAPAHARFAPPFLLSTGCAAGRTKPEAVLHGLCELIERDAAGLWWRGGRRGRPLSLEDAALGEAAALLAVLRRGSDSRRTWLIDITTDLGIPAVAALSAHGDGRGFACGLGARTTLAAAARGALMEMCQIELAQAVVAAKRAESGEAKLNERDRAHITRATLIDAGACRLLHPAGVPARYEADPAADAEAQVRWLTERLAAAGIAAFVVDLTRPMFTIPVVRVVAPGLQIEPSQLTSARLERAIAATGGGAAHTGGVPLF
jgi:ribosomal protein S12 methylthiotransferase accessory factor